MRIEFVIANIGFSLHVNEFDWSMDRKNVISFELFWKSAQPIRAWIIHKSNFSGEGMFSFVTYRQGKRSGWAFQGPIRRI